MLYDEDIAAISNVSGLGAPLELSVVPSAEYPTRRAAILMFPDPSTLLQSRSMLHWMSILACPRINSSAKIGQHDSRGFSYSRSFLLDYQVAH
jgi:hypothetical protein